MVIDSLFIVFISVFGPCFVRSFVMSFLVLQ